MSETYTTDRLAHGPSGTLSWTSATYALRRVDTGASLGSCACAVSRAPGGARKRLTFERTGLRVDVLERAATAADSGTGHALWPGAVGLALAVVAAAADGALAAPATVVELGCGAAALPGIAAALAWPGARVALTDGAPALVPGVAAAAAAAGAANAAASLHDFSGAGGDGFDGLRTTADRTTPPPPPPPPADVVLGAEIAYRAADAAALAAEVPRRLRRDPRAAALLCSDAKRAPLRAAGDLLRARGLFVADDALALDVTTSDGETTTHALRLLTARWPPDAAAGEVE